MEEVYQGGGVYIGNYLLLPEAVCVVCPDEGGKIPYVKIVHHAGVVYHAELQIKAAVGHCPGGVSPQQEVKNYV